MVGILWQRCMMTHTSSVQGLPAWTPCWQAVHGSAPVTVHGQDLQLTQLFQISEVIWLVVVTLHEFDTPQSWAACQGFKERIARVVS